ncbi:MAG: glycosyltransferase family 39 protein [Candidatus Lernaella stagnicola]|nr:glycosyltransferase family 39 protein [Candidatus Lernaella stagnicola]
MTGAIHNESRQWERWATTAVAAYLAIFVLLVHLPTFRGLTSPDAMRYADAARNFLQGEGIVTNNVYPRNLADSRFTERLHAAQVREKYVRHFGYPLVLALPFALLGPSDATVFAFNALLWWLGGLLVFWLGRRLFSVKAGGLAVLLYSLQAKLVAYAVKGVSEPFCIVLLLVGAWLILTDRRAWWTGMLAGALGAFSFFVRQPMLFVTPLTFAGFLLLREDGRWRRAGWIAAGVVTVFALRAVMMPVLFPPSPPPSGQYVAASSSAITASPESATDKLLHRFLGFSFLTFSQRFPGHALERSIDNPRGGDESATSLFAQKLATNLRLLPRIVALESGAPLWAAFFLAACWLGWGHRRVRRLTGLVGVLYAATAFAGIVYFVMPRYFHLFIPFMALVGGYGLGLLVERLAKWDTRLSGAAAAVVVLAVSMPLPFGHLLPVLPGDATVREARGTAAAHEKAVAVGDFLRRETGPEDVVFSDIPWITGWYADRASIWLPLRPEQVRELHRWVAADRLLLTLEDPQGFAVWRDWLLAKRQGTLGADRLGDWTLQAGTTHGGKAVYLFRAPGD